MQSCEIGAERTHERIAVGDERPFPRQAIPLRNAGDALHDEEFAAENVRVAAKEHGFGRDHAGGVRDAQYGELLRARETHRDTRRCIRAQDEVVLATACAAVDVDVEQPVVLDRAAGQPLVASDADVVCVRLAAQPAGDRGLLACFASGVAHVASVFGGRGPRRMRFAMLKR